MKQLLVKISHKFDDEIIGNVYYFLHDIEDNLVASTLDDDLPNIPINIIKKYIQKSYKYYMIKVMKKRITDFSNPDDGAKYESMFNATKKDVSENIQNLTTFINNLINKFEINLNYGKHITNAEIAIALKKTLELYGKT